MKFTFIELVEVATGGCNSDSPLGITETGNSSERVTWNLNTDIRGHAVITLRKWDEEREEEYYSYLGFYSNSDTPREFTNEEVDEIYAKAKELGLETA